jgi:hypothetical protein
MHTRWYDEYRERHKDDDIYQEEIEVHLSFTISDRASLVELATEDAELLEEEPCPSKKCLQKSKCLFKRHEQRERLDACVIEADSNADNFWYVNYLLLL